MRIGDMIPDYMGVDEQGNRVEASKAFAGQALVVYFYPKDSTPGCTAEACSLRDNYAQITSMGYTLVGISCDSPASHVRFTEKNALPFRLLSDPEAEVAKSFGVWVKKSRFGREYMGVERQTFVFGPDHKLENVISKVETKNAGPQLLGVISERPAVGTTEEMEG